MFVSLASRMHAVSAWHVAILSRSQTQHSNRSSRSRVVTNALLTYVLLTNDRPRDWSRDPSWLSAPEIRHFDVRYFSNVNCKLLRFGCKQPTHTLWQKISRRNISYQKILLWIDFVRISRYMEGKPIISSVLISLVTKSPRSWQTRRPCSCDQSTCIVAPWAMSQLVPSTRIFRFGWTGVSVEQPSRR